MKARPVIGLIVALLGSAFGVYVGLWLMFIQPIITMCAAYDAGTLSAMIVGVSVIKMIFASFVGWLIVYISLTIGKVICG